MATWNALTALFGVWGLASGVLALDAVAQARLPWHSPTLGAVALGGLVLAPNAVLALAAVRGDRRTAPGAILTGAALVGWIVVELAFIRELSFFHPLYGAIGFLLIWLGARALREADAPSPPTPPRRGEGRRLLWPTDRTRPKGSRDRRQVLDRP